MEKRALTVIEKVKLWFGPGGKEGYKWASHYEDSLVGLCRQSFCEICNLAEREKLKGFRGGELEVQLISYRRPTFWREEFFYLGHLVKVPERVEVKVRVDEGIEFEPSKLNTLICPTERGAILIDPGSMGFNGGELGFQQLIAGQKIAAAIVTHGHLDHWNHLNLLPTSLVFMSPLTFRLASRHAAWEGDYRLVRALGRARRVSPGEPILLDRDLPVKIETFLLPHSIPETMGLAIKGQRKRLVHLGDFKLNGVESKIKAETIAILSQIAKEPVDILSLNILNAHLEGFTPLEELAIEAITNIIARAKGRVIIACFSTNLERIQRLAEIAQLLRRQVNFFGAGMQNAKELLRSEEGETADPEKAVIFVTGCQAEENSVLWRIAQGENPPFELQPTDTLIFSSRYISGNEKELHQLIVDLRPQVERVIVNGGEVAQLGLKDLDIEEAQVHISGHGNKEDLRLVLDILKPRQVLPWPQTEPQFSAFKEIARGIEIIGEKERIIEV